MNKNFKSVLLAAMLTVYALGVYGQASAVTNPQLKGVWPIYDQAYYDNNDNYESFNLVDSATVGAQLPYVISRDQVVNDTRYFKPSSFMWSHGKFSIVDYSTKTKIDSAADVSSAKVIVTMPTTAGYYNKLFSVQEKANPIIGNSGVGPKQDVDVRLFAKPDAKIETLEKLINTKAANYVDWALTGVPPFYVKYTISGVDLLGSPIGTDTTYTAILNSIESLRIDPAQLILLGKADSVKYGKYTITINEIWDAISRKAINSSELVVSITEQPSLLLIPLPNTQQIRNYVSTTADNNVIYSHNLTPYKDASNYEANISSIATIGSKMPYFVPRTAKVNGATIFSPSQFSWTLSGGLALNDLNGVAVSGTDFVNDTMVVVKMPSLITPVSLSVQEKSIPKGSFVGATGNTQLMSITMVDKPSFNVSQTPVGGCGTSATPYILAVDFSGYAPFTADVIIKAVDTDGKEIDGNVTDTIRLYSSKDTLEILPSQLASFCKVTDVKNIIPGVYTISIVRLWDRASIRALNASELAVTKPIANGKSSGTINIYPIPQAPKVQRVKILK